MVRVTVWLSATVVVVVLLFTYRTSTSGPGGGSSQIGSGGGPGVVGPVVQTRWGPVQVKAVITDNRLTDVVVVQEPHGNSMDKQINDQAVPALRQQALTAQSARIDGVSGATVTSDGYRQSLQGALDTARFGS
jgi:Na+-transporting NADH:ubiquinone oxidoreductase subunit NqrC